MASDSAKLTPLSTHVSPSRAHALATTHILAIFSETDAAARRARYADTYAPDIVVYENDGRVVRGHDGVDGLVERLIGEGGEFEGWVFEIKGEVKLNQDFVWVAWGFGPRGGDGDGDGGKVQVKVTGADGILVERQGDGVVRIKTAYVIIDGASDAKAE